MKILHVIHSLSPDIGGPPEGLKQIMRAYPEIGVEAEVVCMDDAGADYLRNLNFRAHPIGAVNNGLMYSPRLAPWLRSNLDRFHGVVVHGVWQSTGITVMRATRHRLPYAIFTHGALDPWFKKQYPLKHLKKCLYWPIQYAALRSASAVLFTSETEAELAKESFWPNTWNSVVVPYGTNRPAGDPDEQREAFLSVCPQLRNRRYLLFMARIHEKKGCDLLIDAFAHIAGRDPELDLVIAGPDQSGLQAKLQEAAMRLGVGQRIHWPGLLQGDAKWGAFRAAEVFILPSHQENFGIAVAEALACETPVLVSNQVNIWKDVIADQTGFVEEDTAEGTLRLMEKWIALSPAERSAMSERTLPSFLRRYSMKGTALALRKLFSGQDLNSLAAAQTLP
jgi:glycosyltransferase involved in cell wall biosynthesis